MIKTFETPKSHDNTDETNEKDDDTSGNILKELGLQIATVRKILNCTQTIFAGAIGITPQTLSLIERGNFKLTNNLAAKIYFSLYEIVNESEAIELKEYQIICISELMDKLKLYIRGLNLELKTVVENQKL